MTTIATTSSLQRELASIAGERYVTQEGPEINGVTPAATVSPGSAEEVAAVLRLAGERELVVVPAGGATQLEIGAIPERVDILLKTERLNRIKHYDPGDLTVGVEAGVPLAVLQDALAEHRQWIPYDPAKPRLATVGGLLATSAFGPLKAGFGGLRDLCIGIQFVTAEGKLAKGGGNVVKNVAGYDLMKLLIGSYGSLAVIVGANFKVSPRPRQTRTFVCTLPSLHEAVAFRDQVLKSPLTPMCLEIISPSAREYLCNPPVVNDPDVYAPSRPVAAHFTEWQIAVRVSGSDTVLARCKRELGAAVSQELESQEESQFWTWVAEFEYSILQRHRNAMAVYTHVTIQNVEAAVKALEHAAPDYDFIPAMVGRATPGALVMGFVPLAVGPPSAMQFANCASAFRAQLPPGSSAVVARCPKEAKTHFNLWGSTPTDVELMRGVKQALDPKNILNRGRFIV